MSRGLQKLWSVIVQALCIYVRGCKAADYLHKVQKNLNLDGSMLCVNTPL